MSQDDMKPKLHRWIWYRHIRNKTALTLGKAYVQEICGNVIALADSEFWTNYPSWYEIKDIKIVRQEKNP